MHSLKRNIRQWWQPPRNISDRLAHRQVTFLELFYDLIYVVLIAELTHSLSTNINLENFGIFVFLFFIVWWAWLNGTLYHDIHGNDDVRTRVFTFLQMFTVASMAVFAHDAVDSTSAQFALSYGAFQLILTYMWWRTGVYDPNHRPLSRPYVFAFLFTTILFLGSAFVDLETRIQLWIFAVILSFVLPIATLAFGSDEPDIIHQRELSRTPTPSLVERFGLLTIIVLGEVIVGVVQGVAEQETIDAKLLTVAGLGMLIAIGLWWVYFDFVSHRLPKDGLILAWIYAHVPLTIGIASTGAAILNVVEHSQDSIPDNVRWLFVGSIATALVMISVLIRLVQQGDGHNRPHQIARTVMVISAAMIVLLGFTNLETVPLLIGIIILLLTPLIIGFYVWIQEIDETSPQVTTSD